jgi:sulfite exporter TauE/SafE
MDLWVIFLTGLTTGGLSCLVVQGGLLATAMARQVSVPANAPHSAQKSQHARPQATITGIQFPKDPWPVFYFLAAKLIVYTVLGFFLGLAGSALQITPTVQALMQIVAGLFMLVTALNMLNIHPVFRYFVLQPPKAFTRLVRNQAKSQEVFTPAVLGFLTVLIPCGTTQAMEVIAISSGNPVTGALIMLAFVLGTSPTFFVLGFLATRVRGKFQRALTVAAILLILLLGFVSLDNGLTVLGSPLAPSQLLASILRPGGYNTPAGTPIPGRLTEGMQELKINVSSDSWNGYSPNYFTVRSGQPIRLLLITNNTYGCARAFTIPGLGVQKILPATGETVIDIPAQKTGQLAFSCSMGMSRGLIVIS